MSRNTFIAAAWTLLFAFAAQVFPAQCAFAADSADWRSWRGPLGGGSVERGNFPVKFGADKYLWRAELPGRGCSTPILLQDKIYLTSPADGKDALLCYGLDGTEQWRTVFEMRQGAQRMIISKFLDNAPDSVLRNTAVDARGRWHGTMGSVAERDVKNCCNRRTWREVCETAWTSFV